MARTETRLRLALALATAAAACGCGHAGPTSAPREVLTAGARTAERTPRDDATLRIEEFIQRQVPGVLFVRSGGGLIVQIRGQGTLSGSASNALVVIDGVAQESADALLQLSPTQVQKVEVLKDAAAARYGMRGANGVLVVTTRRDT